MSCNGNNHGPTCDCGWGGRGSTGGHRAPPKIFASDTRLTTCPKCGAEVFFHTNGHGDGVFLDELGPPWPRHGCFPESEHSSALRKELTLVVPMPRRTLAPALGPGLLCGVVIERMTVSGQMYGPNGRNLVGIHSATRVLVGGTPDYGVTVYARPRQIARVDTCLVEMEVSLGRVGERQVLLVDGFVRCAPGRVSSRQRLCPNCRRALLWTPSSSSVSGVCHRCGLV
jgi:hypothetical protein